MFYSVDFVQILYFCNASCGSAQNMVAVLVLVVVMMMMMI
jgi:hypothetical protein